VSVPYVKGQTQSQATATLQDNGLTVNPTTTSNCAASSDGLVVGQNPPEGASVQPGDSVAITVCSTSQPTLVVVPSVVGEPESQADAVLQSVGLVAAATSIPDCESGGQGQVISQNPGGGASVNVGSTVGIAVGGPCTSSSPPPIG
jgi:eukaryotic-like serine/threonine-protein kinase